MKDWVNIQSFNRLHQAEICENILEINDISAVIINEKDSLFLIGEIELYVKNDDEAKARALIDEFKGLTKINSFVDAEPIERLHEILKTAGIYSEIKRKEKSEFILDNYELYVKNEDVNNAVPFLTGEKLSGWKLLEKCKRVSQTKFRVDILAEHKVDTIIIKKRDSELHLDEVSIYVPKDQFNQAKRVLTQLNGWIKMGTFESFHWAHVHEDLLKNNNIKAIIQTAEAGFDLYVEANNEERSIDLINKNKEWSKVDTFEYYYEAEYMQAVLIENGIDAGIIKERDSTFLLGETDLYVPTVDLEKAIKISSILDETQNITE